MKKIIKDILIKKKLNVSYNLTSSSKTTFFYPKTYNELKRIIFFLKKEKEKVLIKTGNCGHGDKSNLKNSKYAISLSKFDKIIFFNKKKNT